MNALLSFDQFEREVTSERILAILSTFAVASARSSSRQRRPRAIEAIKVARVSARIGRAYCGMAPSGTITSRRRNASRCIVAGERNGAARDLVVRSGANRIYACGFLPASEAVWQHRSCDRQSRCHDAVLRQRGYPFRNGAVITVNSCPRHGTRAKFFNDFSRAPAQQRVWPSGSYGGEPPKPRRPAASPERLCRGASALPHGRRA